jgi:hypothetical protein
VNALLVWTAAALAAPEPPPPPPYLDRGAVQSALSAVPDAVAACVPADAPAGLARVAARLHPEGRVEPLDVGGAPGDAACWLSALSAVAGPRHAGAPVDVRFAVPLAGGTVGSVLEISLRVEPPDPVFLHVPASLSADQRAALREALGLASPAP